jgi:hypothetical protein
MAIQSADLPKHAQREIPRSAPYIQQRRARLKESLNRLRNQIKNQRGVDRGLLPGLEIAEPLNLLVEPLANLIDGRFVRQIRQLACSAALHTGNLSFDSAIWNFYYRATKKGDITGSVSFSLSPISAFIVE